MIIEYIRYKLEQGDREPFMNAYSLASGSLDQSSYCLAYELSECVEVPGLFILRIEWTSTEEHMQEFRKSEEFRKFFNYVKPYFSNIEEMRHDEMTTVSKRK